MIEGIHLLQIVLPDELKFKLDKEVKNDFNININDIEIRLVRNIESDYYEAIEAKYINNISEELIKEINEEYCIHQYIFDSIRKMGHTVNKFINSFCRITDKIYIGQIYNGEDITVTHRFGIFDKDKNLLAVSPQTCKATTILNEEKIEKIITNISKGEIDLVKEFLRYADIFLENGLFDMAALNISMAVEAFIKRLILLNGLKLSDFENKKLIDGLYEESLRKIYHKGLDDYDDEIHDTLVSIKDMRDKIAHGGTIFEIKLLKEMQEDEIYYMLEDYTLSVRCLFEWIDKLDKK